jgi:hypothetical protein
MGEDSLQHAAGLSEYGQDIIYDLILPQGFKEDPGD